MSFGVFNLPIYLTLVRLILSPLILPLLLVYFSDCHSLYVNSLLALCFLLFGATDFFDGFVARWSGKVTKFGEMLDPVADKVLISSTAITLVALGRLNFFWAVVIIGRELFVMGMREVAARYGFFVKVSVYGKAKTVLQISFLVVLILGTGLTGEDIIWKSFDILQMALLFLSLVLTIGSAIEYFVRFKRELRKKLFLS